MASASQLKNKDGSWKVDKDGWYIWKLRFSRGRGENQLTEPWRSSPEWSQTYTERKLKEALSDFESRCKAGQVLDREEKKAAQAAQEAAQAAAEAEAARQPTIKQYCENVWMPAKRFSCSESSVRGYETVLRLHILPVIGDVKLCEITPGEINAMLIDIANTGRATKDIYQVIYNIFDSAEKDGTIDRIVAKRIVCPKPSKDTKKDSGPEYLDADQLAAFLNVADTRPAEERALVYVLADTGCRIGEALALQWGSIDWTAGAIEITGTRDVHTRGIRNTKNGKARSVDVGQDTLRALADWRQEQSAGGVVCQDVFTAVKSDKPLHHSTAEKWIRKLGEAVGLEGFHAHVLRHSVASVELAEGADIGSISRRLGHTSIDTTIRVYSHSNDSRARKAGSILRNAVKRARDQISQDSNAE